MREHSILIVTATTQEVSPLIGELSGIEEGHCLLLSRNGSIALWILVAGVGAAPYAYNLGRTLAARQFDLVLGVGIAGSYNPSLKLGDVVAVSTDVFADYGVDDRGRFLSLFDIGLFSSQRKPFSNGLLVSNQNMDYLSCMGLNFVSGITVATATGSQDRIESLYKMYSPDIETMEGASLFYCCLMEGVPFISLRAISNRVEPRNRENWDIPLAVKKLSAELLRFVSILNAVLPKE